jgi:hypothetical protein
MRNVIGGEFELSYESLTKKKSIFFDGYLYSSGRSAFYHIIEHIINTSGYRRMFIPNYICESLLNILGLFDITIHTFSIKNDLTVDIEDLNTKYTPESIVLLINYFGGVEMQTVTETIKSWDSDSIVILDNVQAYFEMNSKCDFDYMFTSFRKTFPVPDGAWVKTKKTNLVQYIEESNFSKFKAVGMIAKNMRKSYFIDDKIYLELLEKGESCIDTDLNTGISKLAMDILAKTDQLLVAKKRISNLEYLEFELKKLGITSVLHFDNGKVPLFLPVLFPAGIRDLVRSKLAENNIFCPIHWPINDERFQRGNQMSKEELSLVIDQRYEQKDLRQIIKIIERILT